MLHALAAALLVASPSPAEVLAAVRAADPWAWVGAEVRLRAVVRSGAGAPARELRLLVRARRAAGRLQARVTVTAPGDLAGAGFLLLEREGGDLERWLRLPALGAPRRVEGASRGLPLLGTHLTAADLDRAHLRAAVPRRVTTDTLDGRPCWRLEADVPGGEPYARVVAWARAGDLLPLRVDLYAPSGALLRTLATRELKRLGGHWVATRSVVVDHGRGGETELSVEGWAPVADAAEAFTPAALAASGAPP